MVSDTISLHCNSDWAVYRSSCRDGVFKFAKRGWARSLWLPHLAGGTLMGIGAAVASGGYDALLLYGIPMFSPHALPAFVAMLGTIAVMLWLGKLFADLNIRMDCRQDVCRGAGESAE